MARIIDTPRTQLDNTVRVFDQFYNFDLVINGNQWDIVYSYFYDMSNSKDIAENFSTIIFRLSSVTGQNALDILDYVKGSSATETTALLAFYLNSSKSKTTLYGVTNIPQPNILIQRNIVI